MRSIAGRNGRLFAPWKVIGAIAGIALAAAACSSTTYGYAYSWSTSISSITPTSNSQASVQVDIKNTSSTSGTAHCSLELYSPNHAYSGFEYFESDHVINAGDSAKQTVDVTVYNNGAHQVTVSDSTIRCY